MTSNHFNKKLQSNKKNPMSASKPCHIACLIHKPRTQRAMVKIEDLVFSDARGHRDERRRYICRACKAFFSGRPQVPKWYRTGACDDRLCSSMRELRMGVGKRRRQLLLRLRVSLLCASNMPSYEGILGFLYELLDDGLCVAHEHG